MFKLIKVCLLCLVENLVTRQIICICCILLLHVPFGAAHNISVKAALGNTSISFKMRPWTFLFPYGEKYVLILDLCNNVIAMETARWHLEEDFQSYAHSSAFRAAGHTSALFCFCKVSPNQSLLFAF